MKNGDVIELEIIDMSQEGNGIGKYDNVVVFVEGAILGEVVKVEIIKAKKSFMLAKAIETIKASEYRTEEECRYEKVCGGCSLLNVSYEGQLKIKSKAVTDKLKRIAKIENPKVNPIIAMDNPYRYRNKTKFSVNDKRVGFFKKKSNTVVCDCLECKIQPDVSMAVAEALRQFIIEDHIKKGVFESVTVKIAEGTGQVMVVFNINGKGIPNSDKLIIMINEEINNLEDMHVLSSVVQIIGSGKATLLAGEKTITDKVTMGKEFNFEISAESFYQVNTKQMIKLYEKVMEYADLKGDETVYDLYCGVGTIGLTLADKAKYVVGIDSVKEAVLNANRNATINNIVNAIYKHGKAEDILPELITERPSDVVILDPPRNGCDERLLNTIAESDAKKIVYVSCDPGTLARDIKILEDQGYKFIEATPLDMFPWTVHVETVVLMSRVEK
ncbi:MAG: 23S rRNA (uracil(1939)-C(5))-methyltransferase RlmD [Clostridiales bacterium]|nr:23S rRNA (uracil(1939)-C(5))-methyltransferase RlmD [Clostridiales bacterium]